MGTEIFTSTLYTPPEWECDYFRDGLPPHLTHDFLYFGILLSNWLSHDLSLLLIRDSESSCKLRFRSDDGIFYSPLTMSKLSEEHQDFSIRELYYEELRRCFITRFYQYRLLVERAEIVQPAIDNLQENFRVAEECYQKIDMALKLKPFIPEPTTYQKGRTYCILDGWVEPIATTWENNNGNVSYLLCPHCHGNLDYKVN